MNFVDAVRRLQISLVIDMKNKIQNGGSRSHEWDFTLSTQREILSGDDLMQVAITSKAAHRLFRHGTIALKSIVWHLVQSLRRIIP